jgi:hypothetical protein
LTNKISKQHCKHCGGAYVCTNGECTTITNEPNTMCKACCPTPFRTARSAEIRLASILNKWFARQLLPIYSAWDRQNKEADVVQCGRFRPDFLWEIEEEQRVVILECDEYAHRRESIRCELSRMLQLAIGFGGRPVHIVRYNPDPLPLVKTLPQKEEREAQKFRKTLLLERMSTALAPSPHDDARFKFFLTIEYLYYYDIPGSTLTAPHVQTIAFGRVDEYEAWAEAVIAELDSVRNRAVTRENCV